MNLPKVGDTITIKIRSTGMYTVPAHNGCIYNPTPRAQRRAFLTSLRERRFRNAFRAAYNIIWLAMRGRA